MSRFTVAITTFFALLLLTQPGTAASVAEEQARLSALQQSLEKQQSSLREMREELDDYPAKVSSAEDELMQAEQDLAAEKRELAGLEAQAADSPQLGREISLKEHSVRMAERRVRSEGRMLERFRRYREELREDITVTEQDIAELRQRIREQNQRIANAEAAARAAEQAAAAAPEPEPEAPAPAVASSPPEPEAAEPAPPAAAQAPTGPPELSRSDYEAFQTARDTMARVQDLASSATGDGGNFPNLELSGSDIESTAFTHLGGHQYQAEVVMPSGYQRFRIDSLRFRANISTDNAGETYLFIVDGRDRARLRAAYFKKSLLDYIGQQPVLAAVEEDEEEGEDDLQLVTLPSGERIELSEDDAYALELAREHQSFLGEMTGENAGSREPFYDDLTIRGSMLEETAAFEHLGQDQYRAEVTVRAGRQTVRINRSSFRINVPDADEGSAYLFFVDASSPTRLRLTYYKKSVLDYL